MADSIRDVVKERVLGDMLGSVQDAHGGGWKVLIVDDFTTHVLSSAMRMSDILDSNVSVVEDIKRRREPLPQAAVYFIQPTGFVVEVDRDGHEIKTSVIDRLLDDFGGPDGTGKVLGVKQLYPSAHIFFSNKAPTDVLERIKRNPRLVKSLKTLKELNLEFLTVDSRTISTDHREAATTVFSDLCESNRNLVVSKVNEVVARLATIFSTLKEFPTVRFKAAQPVQPGDPPGQQLRSELSQLTARKLYERLAGMQRAGQLPAKETCDVLVLDRSFDAVAPFIHEFGYEALCYDLLHFEGNVYRYSTQTEAGAALDKEVLLDDLDSTWTDLRHQFIGDVYAEIAARFKEFQAKSKAVRPGDKSGASATAMRQLLLALPQYREALNRLSVHIELSSEVKGVTKARQLAELGELEQDLVLGDGDKKSADMLDFLKSRAGSPSKPSKKTRSEERAPLLSAHLPALHKDNDELTVKTDVMRLLACYLATHPGRLDMAKRLDWQRASGLDGADMSALCGGLSRLGVQVMERPISNDGGGKSSFFGGAKKAKAPPPQYRPKRGGEEEYTLNRYAPDLTDVIGDMAVGRLSAEAYPYVKAPSGDSDPSQQAASARTNRTGLNWAKPKGEQGGAPAGRRLVVFILGGATRGEMRVVHRLSRELNREVLLATSAVLTPHEFVDTLYEIIPQA